MRPSRQAGFTLLELLVVMALMSFLIGLVAPAVGSWLESAKTRAWRADLQAKLLSLPVHAYFSGASLELDAEALRAAVPTLPSDVLISLNGALRYSSSGVAAGGRIKITTPRGAVESWEVLPLTGEVNQVAPVNALP